MLDVNAGIPLADEPRILAEASQLVQAVVDVPISIDSSIIEALEQGLEGEAVVLVELGEGGRVNALSIARSSGHPILDEAALHALRQLGTLGPAVAGKTILLPVRFRL